MLNALPWVNKFNLELESSNRPDFQATIDPMHKGPVKLIQRVKIAHSFLHVMSRLFNHTIFSLSW